MNLGLEALSKTVIWSKYAKYVPELNRRETWDEIIDRYEDMLCRKYPSLTNQIKDNVAFIRQKKVLPSMRAVQFAGKAIEVNNARAYNCCFLHIDSYHAFSETMFLLLGGTGVGYSVQKHHVDKLPEIHRPTKKRKYVVQDSIIGWADAVKALMKSYFGLGSLPDFDFNDIRPKGARLVTAGGKAPGPEPLKLCLFHIQAILDRKKDGENLTTLECHDILCHIANSVLAGGIRRSAMIALFSHDDENMVTCKYGNWWELNEQRGRANNSAVLLRESTTKEEFDALWHRVELSGSGEPGIYWTNNLEWGTNPCCEIALRPFQFCNLCEINVDNIKDQQDLNERVGVAAFFGTLQAGFTDFHYLRTIWQKTTEKDALLGIGMTGIASGKILNLNLEEATEFAKFTNVSVADIIGINHAARITCIKPSGTTSCVRFPIAAPKDSILRTETAIDTLERVKKFSIEWIKPGHINGDNTHNVSATVSIDKHRLYTYGEDELIQVDAEDDLSDKIDEWEAVGEWMWDNREFYNGLSVLPYWGGTYSQAPFEDITEEEYNKRSDLLKDIDLTKVIELDDNVEFSQTNACAGGACETNI